VRRILETLEATGLGYIHLGQPATTLSGGEAQRIKLASELSRRSTGKTLYILDEPTTGLSFQDVAHLLHVLQRLADAGNTVLVIEHHLDVIKNADHIIDLGPLGGDRGGELIAEGTPEEVAQRTDSYTGQYLRPILEAAGTLSLDGHRPAAELPKRTSVARTASVVEESAARAAAAIAERIERETAPPPQLPESKAAQRRARQAARPRKETASERSLREKRESVSGGGP
jgi:excinuclease ABC subunit A